MTGLIAGDAGTILRTINGGANWKIQVSGTMNNLSNLFFINSQTGWAVGNNNTVLKTTDGGIIWIYQPGVLNNKLNSVYFINENTGWISCSGEIYKTTNSGNNWILLNSNSRDLVSIFFIDENTGWVTGSVYTILKSTDGGISWTNSYLNLNSIDNDSPPALFTSVFFVDANTGWFTSAHSFGGSIHKTLDGGANWSVDFPTTQDKKLYALHINDANHGWAVGQAGTVLGNENRITSISNNHNIAEKFSLSQNYPNPFNPSTNIKYHITNNSFVSLNVFDILGREVATMVNEFQKAGTYETQFPNNIYSNKQISSGIYYYTLTVVESEVPGQVYKETKKMLMIK
jgi:photosystem II stability/assembly factor-like uncharacterized protein